MIFGIALSFFGVDLFDIDFVPVVQFFISSFCDVPFCDGLRGEVHMNTTGSLLVMTWCVVCGCVSLSSSNILTVSVSSRSSASHWRKDLFASDCDLSFTVASF